MQSILLICTRVDTNYLYLLKPILSGRAQVHISNQHIEFLTQATILAKQKGVTQVATTSPSLLALLVKKKGVSLDNFAGSIIEHAGIEFLILNPIDHLIKVPYGRFLFERYFSKFLQSNKWMQIPEFTWNLFDPALHRDLLNLYTNCDFISVDIETAYSDDRMITCIGFTGVALSPGSKDYQVTTTVVPFTSDFNIAFVRTILKLPVMKVFQNGKYDNAYLLRYNSITINWSADTAHLFHAWYSELPKRLDFITSFMLRKWHYWKDEAQTTDVMEYWEYNAKDAFTTAMSWLALMLEVPDWGWKNYLTEFPLVFPCLLAEMTGIKRDPVAAAALEKELTEMKDKKLYAIRKMVGNPYFNPSSPKQTLALFKVLGCQDILTTDVKGVDKAAARHPLNKRILGDINAYRKDIKLLGSYLKEDAHWNQRFLYTLNPHGTDTARLASKESAFWCGLQIQNIPRDRKDISIKDMFISDSDFILCEGDYSQAETYDTAHLSGDLKLLEAILDESKDFHGRNASDFFGIPYESIVNSVLDNEIGEWKHYKIDTELRDLSKRTNHGANYNMGAHVLLDTMGIENVVRARKLLNLNPNMNLLSVCQYLLDNFDKTYPVVRGAYHDYLISQITTTKKLVSPLGWTRYCFSDPSKSKHALNSYVAHPSQNLNAGCLNKAWLRVFIEVWLPNSGNFKLHAQIHDSILFSYRKGYEHLVWEVKRIMEECAIVKVTDIFNVTRTMSVPVDIKGGSTIWSKLQSMSPPRPVPATTAVSTAAAAATMTTLKDKLASLRAKS